MKGKICDYCRDENRVAHFNKEKNMFLCDKHAAQIRVYGNFLTLTKFDRNIFSVRDGHGVIELVNAKNEKVGETFIDIEDIERCKKYKWTFSEGRPFATIEGHSVRLSRFIMGLNFGDPMVVDHINHNTIDNRKGNLRVCTQQENKFNMKNKKSRSGAKGVYLRKTGTFMAYGVINSKRIYLGDYKTIQEAKDARENWEIENQKDFRYKEGG